MAARRPRPDAHPARRRAEPRDVFFGLGAPLAGFVRLAFEDLGRATTLPMLRGVADATHASFFGSDYF